MLHYLPQFCSSDAGESLTWRATNKNIDGVLWFSFRTEFTNKDYRVRYSNIA